jgi:hypothetical protein
MRTKISQPLGYMITRKIELVEGLDDYLTKSASDPDTAYHIKSVLAAKEETKRTYTNVFGNMMDFHHEVEKLGIVKHRLRYTSIISLEDSLDYILHRLSGADMENIRAIPNYKSISRALLKLNYDALDAEFGVFSSADKKLASYMENLYMEVEVEDEEERSLKFVDKFVSAVIREVQLVLEYVAFSYYFAQERNTFIPRSKSLCSFVATCQNNLQEELILQSPGFSDYTLYVRSFERWKYCENIALEYA